MKSLKYSLFLIICFVLSYENIFSQTLPIFTLQNFNRNIINPGFAGTHNQLINLSLNARKQWVNINDAPTSGIFNANYFFESINSGIGGTLLFDQLGSLKTTQASLSYNYQIFLDESRSGWLSVGLEPKLYNQSLFLNIADQQELLADMALVNGNQNVTKFDGDIGISYSTDFFHLGIGVDDIMQNASKFKLEDESNYLFSARRVYHFYGEYIYNIPYKDFELRPSLFVKYTDKIPWQFDFQMRANWKEILTFGFNYRKQDSYSILLGFHIKKSIDIIYAYDKTFSDLKLSSQGSHELMLGFHFNTKKK